MCGVEEPGNRGKCTSELCGMAPLESGTPFEIIEDWEVWHLVWKGKIDDDVNGQFIKVAVDHIWENEEVSNYILSSAGVLILFEEDQECS